MATNSNSNPIYQVILEKLRAVNEIIQQMQAEVDDIKSHMTTPIRMFMKYYRETIAKP